MPHHWKPADRDARIGDEKNLEYRGKDKNGQDWELWEISDSDAKEIEKKPKKHDCERVLYP
jgi:hypothetical protein